MKMPIIINENGDVNIYWSLADAETQIEAIDIKNAEYIAYDGLGRLLSLEVITPQVIRIKLDEYEPTHVDEAVDSLRNFVGIRFKKDADINTLSLTDLLALIVNNDIKN